MLRRYLAAKASMFLAFAMVMFAAPAHAGIPVVDAANLSQNLVSALESVSQTLQQIQQYETQIQQYENQLKNTLTPIYQWDNVISTAVGLKNQIDSITTFKVEMGSINSWLDKYKDLNYYAASSCFSSTGCNAADKARMAQADATSSQARKLANDNLIQSINTQQDALTADASQLTNLQATASGAGGQMEALGTANQLASHAANQLLQIRALLLAQQNTVAMNTQAQVEKDARETAATNAIRAGTFTPSPGASF